MSAQDPHAYIEFNASAVGLLNRNLMERKTKNPAYSLRAFARDLGVSPSALSEVMSGKRRVTRAFIDRMNERLCLSPRASGDLLDEWEQRRNGQGTKRSRPSPRLRFTQLDMDQFHFISDWFYYGILSLAETKGFRSDPQWIAERLGVSETRIRVALERLIRLEMLRRDDSGKLVSTQATFKTTDGIPNPWLRRHHHQYIDLAKASIERDSVDERDITGLTLAIDKSRLAEAKKAIRRFRDGFCLRFESGRMDEVYRLNLQMFPLSRKRRKKS